MLLTDAQLATVARLAGFANSPGQYGGLGLTWAVAIQIAESGGNTLATNHNTNGTTDYGLFQINSVHSQYDTSRLFDPSYNAAAAFAIAGGGTSFTPWSSFNNGAAAAAFGRAGSAVSGVAGVVGPVIVTFYSLNRVIVNSNLTELSGATTMRFY